MGYSPVGNLRKDIDTILSDVDKFRDRAIKVDDTSSILDNVP